MGSRILILGSTSHAREVASYAWGSVPSTLNVADYDKVILNFVPFLDPEVARNQRLDELPPAADFLRLLFSVDGEVIAIGDPSSILGSNPYQSVTYWLPVVPAIHNSVGQTITSVAKDFDYYFHHVSEWSWYADSSVQVNDHFPDMDLSQVDPGAIGILGGLYALAETRFQQPIGFIVQPHTVREGAGYDRFVRGEYGRAAVWLPPCTDLSSHGMIDLLLKHRYEVLSSTQAPSWSDRYPLPDESPVRERLRETEEAITLLRSTHANLIEELADASRFRMLLYESGQDALEPVVRDALRELGAHVEDPAKPGREDGRLQDPASRKGTLEIKGRTGSLKLADVRQLDQWVRDNILEGWDSKGILVANLHCEDPPDSRGVGFPDNCIVTAERFGITLVTTTQLFEALRRSQLKELDPSDFWNSLMEENGQSSLPELRPA